MPPEAFLFIHSLLVSERKYEERIKLLDNIIKKPLMSLLESESPAVSRVDLILLCGNIDRILAKSNEMINVCVNYISNRKIQPFIDALVDFFTNESADIFSSAALSCGRSFQVLTTYPQNKPKLFAILTELQKELPQDETLGSLLISTAQRIHEYIPIIEILETQFIEEEEHPGKAGFICVKRVIEDYIAALPVVSKVGITKLLSASLELEQNQLAKFPELPSPSVLRLENQLLAEGIIWEIKIINGKANREKCYLVLLVDRLICVPFDKKNNFKSTYKCPVGEELRISTDVNWSVSLQHCSYSTLPLYSLFPNQGSAGKEFEESYIPNRRPKGVCITQKGAMEELIVIQETSLTNMDPYWIHTIHYLIPDPFSPKGKNFWAHSLRVASGYHSDPREGITDLLHTLQDKCNDVTMPIEMWCTLEAEAELTTYEPGDVIMKEYDPLSYVYWFKQGHGSILRKAGGLHFKIGIIQEREFFGEIGFLTSSTLCSASVIACPSMTITVCSISYSALAGLLEQEKNMISPFSRYVSAQLIDKLSKCSYVFENKPPKKEPIQNSFTLTKAPRTDKDYKDLLKTVTSSKPTVHFAGDCTIAVNDKKPHSGTVLCLEDIILLHMKGPFGRTTKFVVPLHSLNPPTRDESVVFLSLSCEQTQYSLVFRDNLSGEEFVRILELRTKQLGSNSVETEFLSLEKPPLPLLSEENWYSLLAHAKVKKFKAGDMIVEQGKEISFLYHISEGTCDVQICFESKGGHVFQRVVETYVAGSKFGETCFLLPNAISPCSVLVTSSSLEVLTISKEMLLEMNEEDPTFLAEFYCYITQQLASRFTNRKTGRNELFKHDLLHENVSQVGPLTWLNVVGRGRNEEVAPELVVSAPSWQIECGNFRVSGREPTSSTSLIDGVESDYPLYQIEFSKKDHINMIGYCASTKAYVAVSIVEKEYRDGTKAIVILVRREKDGALHFKITESNTLAKGLHSLHSTIPLLKFKLPELKDFHFYQISGDKKIAATKDFLRYEQNEAVTQYKFGVLYQMKGQQTETELYSACMYTRAEYNAPILSSSPLYLYSSLLAHLSHDLLELMTELGDVVKLDGWGRFNGGLDVTGKNITGAISYFTCVENSYEVMFHVAPLIPCEPNDTQNIGKKRHVGNDMVILVFSDSDTPLDPSIFESQFNHYFLVVKKIPVPPCGGPTSYRVEAICKDVITVMNLPLIPSSCIVQKKDIRNFILVKLINAERATMKSPYFQSKVKRTRNQLLESYGEKYAPHLEKRSLRLSRRSLVFNSVSYS